ncbi:MAG TPA: hypothetical protein VFT22_20215, partial [Kofleriaceae bacterium]|nr:hypothetical protein [Kofleriaceae bacterium]
MNIVLFSTLIRVSLAAAAVALISATVVFVRRGHGGLGALTGVAALLAGGALAAEALVALTVRLAAPGAADFNEYRWVFLAPWGRFGLAVGAAMVAGIVALSWRASRGANAWRRATMIGLRAGAAVTALVVFLEPAVELRQVAREPNRIAFLIDDSRSMALREDPRGPSRISRARRLLAASSDTLAGWERDHKIDYYTFAETVSAT